MARYFLDSSVVVKYYHAERGSDAVIQLLGEPTDQFFIARLAVVEVQRALVGKVRGQLLTLVEKDTIRQRFYDDLLQHRWRVRRMHDHQYHAAVRLVNKHSPDITAPMLRSLDALQLATALDIHRQSGLDYFVSTDTDLCTIAASEQLSVINPMAES